MNSQNTRDKSVLRFRIFRCRHGISLHEIARGAGVSTQQVSRLELLERPVTRHAKMLLLHGMEQAIHARACGASHILRDYRMQQYRLFDETKEGAE